MAYQIFSVNLFTKDTSSEVYRKCPHSLHHLFASSLVQVRSSIPQGLVCGSHSNFDFRHFLQVQLYKLTPDSMRFRQAKGISPHVGSRSSKASACRIVFYAIDVAGNGRILHRIEKLLPGKVGFLETVKQVDCMCNNFDPALPPYDLFLRIDVKFLFVHILAQRTICGSKRRELFGVRSHNSVTHNRLGESFVPFTCNRVWGRDFPWYTQFEMEETKSFGWQ